MSVQGPTPEAARSALREADARRSAVHASDRLYRPTLLVIAALWMAGSILIAVMPSSGVPEWVGPLEGVVMGLFLACAIAIFVLVSGRQQAHSRIGSVLFGASIAAFFFWMDGVRYVTTSSGWVVPGDPLRGAHFVLSAVISVAPLLVGALVVGRRR